MVIGSLYTPTADRSEDQASFLDILEQKLLALDSTNVLLGGDFNVALNPALDRKGNRLPPSQRDNTRQCLQSLSDEFDLMDAWRYRNPSKCRYTFHRADQASRLDLWLISGHLMDCCTDSGLIPTLSDHTMITLELGEPSWPRGPGIWHFDNALLSNEDFIQNTRNLLIELTSDHDISDPVSRWEWIKYNIRKLAIATSTTLRRERRAREIDL